MLDAVAAVNLTAYTNAIYCLIGHNGAGQSTTLQTLAGHFESINGKVSMLDKVLPGDPGGIRRTTGSCGQETMLLEFLTVSPHVSLQCLNELI